MEIPKTGFFFDAEKHRYYLDSVQMTGVTTILNVLAKPALIQWAADMAVDRIKTSKVWQLVPETPRMIMIGDDELATLLEEARKTHAQKRDKSADIGTQAHAWIEKWIKADMKQEELPNTDPTISLITDNFLKWTEEAKPTFLASEKVVFSRKNWYAGTLDFIAEIDGKTYLGDIKTGSNIYKEMQFQVAGYQLALEETDPSIKIQGHIIVNPTKDGRLNVQKFYDYEGSKQGFLSCLNLYRLLNQNL